MLYAIMGVDAENSLDKRMGMRPEHLDRLEILKNQGRLILAGPHPAVDTDYPGDAGFTGSLIVAEFPTLEEATKWADDDPYNREGIFQSISVKPFKKVLP